MMPVSKRFGIVFFGLLVAAWDHTNVKLGDADYPKRNPQPARVLKLSGTADVPFEVQFALRWDATNPDCRYWVDRAAGASAEFVALEPLAVERAGQTFKANVPIDGVDPGRCRWKFGGLRWSGPSGAGDFLIQTNSLPLKPGQSPNGVVNLVCKLEPVGWAQGEPRWTCRAPKREDGRDSVLGGRMWWHPEAEFLEVHFRSAP